MQTAETSNYNDYPDCNNYLICKQQKPQITIITPIAIITSIANSKNLKYNDYPDCNNYLNCKQQ